jgi:hypothetical protein
VNQVYLVSGASRSALCAAPPIFVMLLMLAVLRRRRDRPGGCGGGHLVAGFIFDMPWRLVFSSTVFGAAFGLFPIAWVVFWAIALYRLTVDTGQFDIIRASIGGLTQDRRLQALLIAFAFGAFVEGAAGFGMPVAVDAAMLTGLGFSPFYAAGICLLANTAPVAFGSIDPVTPRCVNLPPGFSAGVGRICAPSPRFYRPPDARARWPQSLAAVARTLVAGLCSHHSSLRSTSWAPFTDILLPMWRSSGSCCSAGLKPRATHRRRCGPGTPAFRPFRARQAPHLHCWDRCPGVSAPRRCSARPPSGNPADD